jgi:class 3 adenylate cyclase
VTVLCADLKDSLERLAEGDSEKALEIFEATLTLMRQTVHRFGGTVNIVTGEGIVAVFGAPVALEDHAVRACLAALEIREAVQRNGHGAHNPGGSSVLVRAGLSSGEVVTRLIKSGPDSQYRAIGSTAHLAARLGQIAPPGTLLLSAQTLRLVEGHVQVKALETANASNGQLVYELVGAEPTKSRFKALASRGLTSFVGRNAELEQLERLEAKARRGQGQVTAIIGEPGLGKSRLVHEFVRRERASPSLVLETASRSYRSAASYEPVIDLLKTYFGIADSDEIAERRNKVAGRLLGLDGALAPDLSALLVLLDIAVEEQSWQELNAFQRRERMLTALKRLILREAQQQPVILVLEDLHWIDSETQAFLETLIDGLASAHVLLILTYRPEYNHHWGSKTYYTQLRLDALPPETADAFLRSLLGDDPSLVALKQSLQSQGNPLFLEESVRTLVETNRLDGARGDYRLVRPTQELPIPPTVHALLAARVDRLPGRSKRLLHAAAVIGKDVPRAILQHLADFEEVDFRCALGNLQKADFLYEARLFPDLEYTFKHALTHDVAYESLLQERRGVLHGQVLDAMERLYPHRLTDHAEALGYHAVRGKRWDKAVTYLRLAADKARARSAEVQAIVHVQQAIHALEHLPVSRARTIDAIELRLDLRHSYYLLGDWDRIAATLDEAQRLAEAAGVIEQLGWVVLYIGENFRLGGDLVRACSYFERARTLAGTEDVPLRILAIHYLGMAFHGAGRYAESVDLFRTVETEPRAFEGRPASGSPGAGRVVNTSWLVRSLAMLGRFEQAIVEGGGALASAERLGSAYSILLATLALGEAYRERGDWARAISALERSLAVAREGGFGLLIHHVASRLGAAYAHAGRLDEGLTLLRDAAASVGSRHTRYPAIVRLLGEVSLLRGDLEEAQSSAAAALDAAQALYQRGDEVAARWLLGVTASRPIEAQQFLDEALAHAVELGMRPLIAHCHRSLGKLYQRIKARHAQEHLTTAVTMYREMDMTYWLEQAEAELRQQC